MVEEREREREREMRETRIEGTHSSLLSISSSSRGREEDIIAVVEERISAIGEEETKIEKGMREEG